MKVGGRDYRTVWMEGACLKLIDQNLLPFRFEVREIWTLHEAARAISEMTVRGAGAIGATGAFAMALAALNAAGDSLLEDAVRAREVLKRTRPTAKNLFYGIERVFSVIEKWAEEPERARKEAGRCAMDVADEDAESCRRIGEWGEPLVKEGATILTHCNAGWLAFVDWGSALSPVYRAHRMGKGVRVLADETRPRSQGARLTAWELSNEGVPFLLISDTAAASFMQRGEVDMVVIGADRIARNGDTANKIGSLPLAIAARYFAIPFYVAAPSSTFDRETPTGEGIIIEERSEEEVLHVSGKDDSGRIGRVRVAPEGVHASNPAFDIVPEDLITAFITERGVFPPASIF